MKISLSKTVRYWLCPGALLLEQDPRCPKIVTPEMERGLALHEALAKGDGSGLSPELYQLFEQLQERTKTVVDKHLKAPVERITEYKIQMKLDPETKQLVPTTITENGTGDVYLTGVVDLIFRDSEGKVMLVEYKTGMVLEGNILQTARQQVQSYVAIVAQALGVDSLYTALIWPQGEKVELWASEHVTTAIEQLAQLALYVKEYKDVRVPGTLQCQFCAAKSICPEYATWAADCLSVIGPVPPIVRSLWDQPMATWPIEVIREFPKVRLLLKELIRALELKEEEYKELLKSRPDIEEQLPERVVLRKRERVDNIPKLYNQFRQELMPYVLQLFEHIPNLTEQERQQAAESQIEAAFLASLVARKSEVIRQIQALAKCSSAEANRLWRIISEGCITEEEYWSIVSKKP